MSRVQQGDARAYEALYDRHRAEVYGFLRRRLPDAELAADVFQDTWLNVFRGRATWHPHQRFRPWMFAISVNAIRDSARRAGRRVHLVDVEGELGVVQRAAHEQRMTLEAAVAALPEHFREVFLLAAVHGLDHRELAEALDITPDNARARLTRARAALRGLLGGAQ